MSDLQTPHKIELGAQCRISDVAELHSRIMSANEVHEVLEIDCSEIASIDAAAIQCCLAIQKSASNDERRISFVSLSPTFLDALSALGLEEEMGVE